MRYLYYFKVLTLSILIFFIIYNVSFKFSPLLTTGRMALIFLLLWVFVIGKLSITYLKSRVWLLFLPFFYVLLQYFIVVDDFGQTSRFIHLFLYSFLGSALVALIAKDIKIVLISILLAITIQSIILLYSFFNIEYRIWFDAVTILGSNYPAEYLYRAPGFSGDGGASLSLTQSLGVFIGWLLLRDNIYYKPVSGWMVYVVLLAMTFSFLSCFVVGRTGITLAAVFLVIFLYSFGLKKRLILFSVVITVVIYLFLTFIFTSLVSNDFSVDYFASWIGGLLSSEDKTFSTLATMNVPLLTLETLLGTGLNSIVDGANPSGNDSGFIQAYYSMGLIVAVFFYSVYLYILYYALKPLPVFIRIILMSLFFLIEVKEPFVFKYSLMFVVMSLHFSHMLFNNRNRI
jgi:hypothetical protein